MAWRSNGAPVLSCAQVPPEYREMTPPVPTAYTVPVSLTPKTLYHTLPLSLGTAFQFAPVQWRKLDP